MRFRCISPVSVVFLIAASVAAAPVQKISDPHEILNRYFQAAGGLGRLLAEQTSYSEGAVSLGGMEGTLKVWMRKPGQSRAEIAVGPLTVTQGDDGEHAWVLDQNRKLQVITHPDDATVRRRQVRRMIDQYAFAKPGSDVFTVTLQGIDQVEGRDCYVIRITNGINVDSYTYYINAQTFVREKAVFVEDIESRDAFYGDYRDAAGLMVPFWTKEVQHQSGQTQETKITQYVSNPELADTLFAPPAQGAKDYQFITADRSEDIPFKFIGNHLYIPVIVNGKERLWVLDTGAGMTVLSTAFAKELGLELTGELKGQGAGGRVATAALTSLPPFSVKGIQFQGQTAAVIDMAALIRKLGVEVVGILGFDFLSRFVTKIDFANELVSFYEPGTFRYAGNGHVVDMHIANSLFGVEATLDGTHSGNWLFDVGAGTTHLDGCYALREGYAEKDGILRMGHGAGGEYQLKEIKCDSIQFAGFTVHDPEIDFAYGGTDTTFTADQMGVLGNSLFRNFVLYCDYASERLIVEQGSQFDHRWPVDNSGLQVAWSDDGKVQASYVSPDSPADEAGFAKGDLLRSVNGIGVDLLDGVIAVRELLKSVPGTTYEFVVDRTGESKKLKLTLARLF